MLVRDLIARLEKLIYDHDNGARYYKGEDMLGECEIHIDCFHDMGLPGAYVYRGASPDVRIEPSGDGVLHILSAFEVPKEEKKV